MRAFVAASAELVTVLEAPTRDLGSNLGVGGENHVRQLWRLARAMRCDQRRESRRGRALHRVMQVTAADTQRRQDGASTVAAHDDHWPAEDFFRGLPERRPGRLRVASVELHAPSDSSGPSHYVARLVRVVDRDPQRSVQARSAATPGNSLPSSHSRKAPPAVET